MSFKKEWKKKTKKELREELDFRIQCLKVNRKELFKESAVIGQLKVFILTGKGL